MQNLVGQNQQNSGQLLICEQIIKKMISINTHEMIFIGFDNADNVCIDNGDIQSRISLNVLENKQHPMPLTDRLMAQCRFEYDLYCAIFIGIILLLLLRLHPSFHTR